MKELLFATHNNHKKEEIQQIVGEEFIIKSLSDYDLNEEIVEDGDTFKANALIKAKYCYEKTGLSSIGDDSGLVVEALDGKPGIFSARYASDHDFDKNIEKVLEELKNKENRSAYFITMLCFYDENGAQFFEGKVHGKITEDHRGHKGFGYDPIFLPDGYDITFAEMKPEQKNEISHRRNALNKFLSTLQSN